MEEKVEDGHKVNFVVFSVFAWVIQTGWERNFSSYGLLQYLLTKKKLVQCKIHLLKVHRNWGFGVKFQ